MYIKRFIPSPTASPSVPFHLNPQAIKQTISLPDLPPSIIRMYFSKQLIAFVAATLVTSSLTSPVQPLTRPFNCNDPKQGVNKNCWNELKVEDHLTDWVAHLPARCKKGEAWSVCYDRVATTNLEQDCTQINSTRCQPFDPNFPYIHPQWYYGAYNTWCMY